MPLDLQAAERQSFGYAFKADAVAEVKAGKIRLAPHPVWTMPRTITWRENPFQDNNWLHQFHMLRWLDPMRRAAEKGDTDAFALWLKYAKSWTESNPPGRARSPWAWKNMVDGLRCMMFALSSTTVARHAPEELGWLEDTLRTHVKWLSDERHLGHSNHALHQHLGLFVAARVLRDEAASDLAVTRLGALLATQYDDQGMNSEGATAYHYRNYQWWDKALRRLDLEGVPRPPQAARLEQAPTALAHATRPDGTLVTIGDTDPGDTIAQVRHPHADYVRTGGSDGTPPDETVKVYDAGYVFGRSGWGEAERSFEDETYYSLSFGSSKRVHGHHDGGSVTFSSWGTNWIVDPGKFQYGKSAARSHFLSRHAHSLVSIDGCSPRDEASVTMTRHSISDDYHEFVFDDDSFPDISLTRRVIYSTRGEYVVVVDGVRSARDVTACLRWQCGPDVSASTRTSQSVDLEANGRSAFLQFTGTRTEVELAREMEEPFDGWVSAGWKKKSPATAVLGRKTGKNFRFISVLVPAAQGQASVTVMKTETAGAVRLSVDNGKVEELIEFTPRQVSFPADEDAPAEKKRSPLRLAPNRQKGPRPAILDAAVRGEAFRLVEEARRRGWEADAPGRRQIAIELAEAARDLKISPEMDLGVTACISDLVSRVRNKGAGRRVGPHRTALMNWGQDAAWRPTYYQYPTITHRDRFDLDADGPATAIHTIGAGPLLLPFALDRAEGDCLTVIFHGALNRGTIRLPIFQRWRAQLEFSQGPTLAFADPTLDLATHLRLGWYMGTEDLDLHAHMAALTERVAKELDVTKIVLAGSSGGGFAALHIASLMTIDATVVAFNPQTDIRRYIPGIGTNAYRVAFGKQKAPEKGELSTRISVQYRIDATGRFPRVKLVSNIGDNGHRTGHEAPLRDFYAEHGHHELFTTEDIDLGRGHKTPGNDVYGRIMRETYESLE